MEAVGELIDELKCKDETNQHIYRVGELLNVCIKDLMDRAHEHDQSKLRSPEVEWFAKRNNTLAGVTYNSEQDKANKEFLKVALDHHYARNRHHPQYHKNGVDDMNLLDLIEMLIDWKASSERHNDGNIRKSIELNADRFEISPQLVRILENTVKDLDLI
jgi:hypothetical protein